MKSPKRSKVEKKRAFSIQGIGATPGFARGKAVVVSRELETYQRKSGAVGPDEGIVVVMRTPDLNLFMQWYNVASGFVFEMGGRLCHAALVCLEMGKPCIVGAAGLIEGLRDNLILEIDGFSGTVKVLREKT